MYTSVAGSFIEKVLMKSFIVSTVLLTLRSSSFF
jgi:hypothetical protein